MSGHKNRPGYVFFNYLMLLHIFTCVEEMGILSVLWSHWRDELDTSELHLCLLPFLHTNHLHCT